MNALMGRVKCLMERTTDRCTDGQTDERAALHIRQRKSLFSYLQLYNVSAILLNIRCYALYREPLYWFSGRGFIFTSFLRNLHHWSSSCCDILYTHSQIHTHTRVTKAGVI